MFKTGFNWGVIVTIGRMLFLILVCNLVLGVAETAADDGQLIRIKAGACYLQMRKPPTENVIWEWERPCVDGLANGPGIKKSEGSGYRCAKKVFAQNGVMARSDVSGDYFCRSPDGQLSYQPPDVIADESVDISPSDVPVWARNFLGVNKELPETKIARAPQSAASDGDNQPSELVKAATLLAGTLQTMNSQKQGGQVSRQGSSNSYGAQGGGAVAQSNPYAANNNGENMSRCISISTMKSSREGPGGAPVLRNNCNKRVSVRYCLDGRVEADLRCGPSPRNSFGDLGVGDLRINGGDEVPIPMLGPLNGRVVYMACEFEALPIINSIDPVRGICKK